MLILEMLLVFMFVRLNERLSSSHHEAAHAHSLKLHICVGKQ